MKNASLWVAGGWLPANGQPSSSTTPGIVCNQAGYLKSSAKTATVRSETGGEAFQLISEQTGKPVLSGKLSSVIHDAASGERVTIADFSQLSTPGTYRVASASLASAPFPVGERVYAMPLRLAMRSFYGQRCGCPVNLGDGYHYQTCHTSGAFHRSSGKSGPLANTGGWHDAGDYGRYIVNSSVTCGTLLLAWELYPRPLRALSLDIPESGGKLPDFLAEVKWNLDWMLSQQDSDGGIWHKQTSEQFCGFVMPDEDKLTSYVIGTGSAPYKGTCATASFCATMAMAARCYASYDAAFSSRCLAAAKQAWNWAVAHPNVSFHNPPGVSTGAYADGYCGDELLWASAELWRSTGEQGFEQAFLQAAGKLSLETEMVPPSWSDVMSFAFWTYALAERKGDAGMRSRIIAQTQAAAQFFANRAMSSGFGSTLAVDNYVWGSNGVAANQSLLLLVADHFASSSQIREAAFGNLHYLLGRNCFGVSWVTHVGSRPYLHPHHRPSVASRLPAPWPGLLAGGPNAKPADKMAQKLPPMPPMHMWVDDATAFSVNEVAINWNASLVFLLAAGN